MAGVTGVKECSMSFIRKMYAVKPIQSVFSRSYELYRYEFCLKERSYDGQNIVY